MCRSHAWRPSHQPPVKTSLTPLAGVGPRFRVAAGNAYRSRLARRSPEATATLINKRRQAVASLPPCTHCPKRLLGFGLALLFLWALAFFAGLAFSCTGFT